MTPEYIKNKIEKDGIELEALITKLIDIKEKLNDPKIKANWMARTYIKEPSEIKSLVDGNTSLGTGEKSFTTGRLIHLDYMVESDKWYITEI